MKDKQQRTVIHLEINGEHHYFGSMANLYQYYTSSQLGIAYSTLRKYGLSEDKLFMNDKCIIRKGVLLSKQKVPGVIDTVERNCT
ncbi:hypothetical protein [Prevotella melaninogenica]|uniref:hypothetical protein n=1 Tax=Prevotella melaninogenica TaxID=28132 RepID=UPI000691ED70|nr:hypothetical protein [Prevotella melaninogenica]